MIILLAAKLLFGVPMIGSLALLGATMMLYIAALLGLGFAISTLAANQLQAMQMTFFFFLPTMLLSGFMFPFRGMPQWAQVLGEIFPRDAFPADRARHPAQGQRRAGHCGARLADRAVHGRRRRARDVALSADARLRGRIERSDTQ